MQLGQIVTLLGCDVRSGGERLELEVRLCFAADLMSDVLAFADHGGLLITGLSSAQSVHTAEIADMSAILLVGGKQPTEEAIAIARRRGLPLLVTELSMFDACGLLHEQGLRTPPIPRRPAPTAE